MPLTRDIDTFRANPDAILKDKEEKARKVRKEIIDLENAERVNKTYHWTQLAAWISFAVALFLGFLELAEALKWWPYHK